MSLKYFHMLFIAVSALLLLGLAGWVFLVAGVGSEPGLGILGTACILCGLGLLGYLAWFIRKSKNLP